MRPYSLRFERDSLQPPVIRPCGRVVTCAPRDYSQVGSAYSHSGSAKLDRPQIVPIIGTIAPGLGITMLDEILFGRTRAAVLRELYANPDRRVSFNELVRRLKSGAGAISRELATLTSAGLISEEREGNQRFVSACVSSPLYAELKAFIRKASGAPEFIREALHGLEDKIDVAVVFGSVATGTERPDSDLDLFVVGTAGYSLVAERMYSIEKRVGRKVQTLYFDVSSPADRASLQKTSMRAMLSGPKLFVIGDAIRLDQLLSTEGTEHGKKSKSRQSRKGSKARATRR